MAKEMIAHSWAIYRQHCVPPHASAVQVDETRKAFFAGAITIVEAVKRIAENDISEEVGMRILELLHAEVSAYETEQLSKAREVES